MTPRPSQLDPYVPVSVHTAPDVLSFRFCSCERIDDGYQLKAKRKGRLEEVSIST